MTAFEAWASHVGQIGNGARDPAPTVTGLVEPRSGMGHHRPLGGRFRSAETLTDSGRSSDERNRRGRCQSFADAPVIVPNGNMW